MKRLLIAALLALTLTGCAQLSRLQGLLEVGQAVLPDLFQGVAIRQEAFSNKFCNRLRAAATAAEFQASLDKARIPRMAIDDAMLYCSGGAMPE